MEGDDSMLWGLDELFWAHVKLMAADVMGLTPAEGPPPEPAGGGPPGGPTRPPLLLAPAGTSVWLLGPARRPVRRVEVVGQLVALRLRERDATGPSKFTLEDPTGTIDGCLWPPRGSAPEPAGHGRGPARSGWQQAQLQAWAASWAVLQAAPGLMLRVRGRLGCFDGRPQLQASAVELLGPPGPACAAAVQLHWLDAARLRHSCYEQPAPGAALVAALQATAAEREAQEKAAAQAAAAGRGGPPAPFSAEAAAFDGAVLRLTAAHVASPGGHFAFADFMAASPLMRAAEKSLEGARASGDGPDAHASLTRLRRALASLRRTGAVRLADPARDLYELAAPGDLPAAALEGLRAATAGLGADGALRGRTADELKRWAEAAAAGGGPLAACGALLAAVAPLQLRSLLTELVSMQAAYEAEPGAYLPL